MKQDNIGLPAYRVSDLAPRDGAGDAFRMFLLDEAAVHARESGRDVIQLTLGISDRWLREEVLAVISSAASDPITARRVCPAGLPELREALSEHYGRTFGISVSPHRILVDAGTSSIVRNLLQLVANPGDEVLIPLPYYPLYRFSAHLARAICRHYEVSLETLRIDADSIARAISERTRAIILNSPGNPLGNVISPTSLADLLTVIPPYVYMIFDGVYDNIHFTETARPLTPVLLANPERRSRLIVTNSFSKGYRMYTRRVGWCILPDELVEPMTIIQQHTRLTVDPAVQLGAVEALKHPGDVEEVRTAHRARWDRACAQLGDLEALGVRLLPAAGGFYCVLDCRAWLAQRGIRNCLELAKEILSRVGIATVPGADFGLSGMLRVSFTNARFSEAVERLRSFFISPVERSGP